MSEEGEEGDRTNLDTSGHLHHRAIIKADGDASELEADHVMVFTDIKTGEERDSNDVMSKRKYETLVFITREQLSTYDLSLSPDSWDWFLTRCLRR